MRRFWKSTYLHILLGRVLGNILLFTDGICTLAFSCTIAYYHNKPTFYHLDYPLTSLLTYYGNPFWYEVGHFFPALWVNYSPALTALASAPLGEALNNQFFRPMVKFRMARSQILFVMAASPYPVPDGGAARPSGISER